MPRPRSAQPKTRKNPRPEVRVQGRLSRGSELENTVEGFHYVWASPADPHTGLQNYLAMGYEVQRYEPGGVKPKGKNVTKDMIGQDVTFTDMVLVGIDGESRAQDVEYGPYGDGGQAMWDEIEERLLVRGGDDHLRGMYQLSQEPPTLLHHEAEAEHGIARRR